jgi:tRNA-dihydrouridine synthase
MPETLSALLARGSVLALAPMQEVTDLAFWTVVHPYGGADVYWTEYFRVHADSTPESWIVESIRENPTGRPVIAQMIGNDIPSLVRTAKQLLELPVAAIDLNLGCPAPIVYRKCAGGGLLREPARIDAILGALRDAIPIPFTVKTRVGFASGEELDRLLPIFAKHGLDALTVHGRTVAQSYRPPVRYDLIREAAAALPCPVIANGDVRSAAHAQEIVAGTGARGLMIGRGAIRNPWLFAQIRQHQRGDAVALPTGRDVWAYVLALWDSQPCPGRSEQVRCARMKKFMNYLGEAVPGPFLHRIRRVTTAAEFHAVCAESLDHDRPMPLEPIDDAARAPVPAAPLA